MFTKYDWRNVTVTFGVSRSDFISASSAIWSWLWPRQEVQYMRLGKPLDRNASWKSPSSDMSWWKLLSGTRTVNILVDLAKWWRCVAEWGGPELNDTVADRGVEAERASAFKLWRPAVIGCAEGEGKKQFQEKGNGAVSVGEEVSGNPAASQQASLW